MMHPFLIIQERKSVRRSAGFESRRKISNTPSPYLIESFPLQQRFLLCATFDTSHDVFCKEYVFPFVGGLQISMQ